MTDKPLLKSYMAKHGDTQSTLAIAMGVSLSCLNAKINQTGGASFKQSEIAYIRMRYALSPEEVNQVFFTSNLS